MKIFPKTLLIVVSIAVIPLLIALLIAYSIAEKTLTEHILRELEAIAHIQEHRVEDGILRLKERLDLVRSRVPALVAIERFYETGEKAQQDIAISALAGAKAAIDEIKIISILSMNGRVVASTDSALHDKDFSKEEFFVSGSHGYYLDSFAFSNTGEVVMNLACPVEYQGRRLGVLVIESSPDAITALTRDYTGLGKTGEALLARKNKDGNVLYITPLRFDRDAALKRTVPWGKAAKPIVQALLKQESVLEDELDYRGEHVFAATRHIKETDWGLVVKMDRAEVFNPLEQMRYLFISLVVVTAILVVLVAFLVSGKVVKPIVQLSSVAGKISEGDLLLRAEVTSGDEIGELQQYFNKMTDDLTAANAFLDQKVKDRTAELFEVNRSLILEVQERMEAERKLLHDEARLKVLLDIAQFRSKDIQEMLDFTLHEVIRLSRSRIGYIYFYDEQKQEFTLNSWSKDVMTQCLVMEKKTCYELGKTGIWGEAVRQRKPIMLNDFPASHSLKKGYPEGHVPLLKYLTVPVFREDRIVAVVAVANKETDYTEDDVKELTIIMDAVWQIVERQEAERELARYATALERSNKELEQFAYVASHDLQEPLRKIASFTELLSSRYRGKLLDEKADTFMEFIVDGARRMQRLINDLLTFSRVMTQGREFTKTDCNLVLSKVLQDLDLSIRENNAAISCGTLPVVIADQTQMAQLFQNLIGNAIKYHGEDQPRVEISAELKGQDWQFSITDNGIGIAQEFYDRIFVLFQRLHAKTEYTGTGIGLAVCKKIVERHRGKIWVESAPGRGSTFFFTIPASMSSERQT